MQTNKEVIRSVLIPLTEDALLLPHSALIEIIPERDIRQLDGSPEWVVGEIEWNNETMPLLSIETATGSEKHQQSKRSRLIVLAFLTKNNRYNYLAIRATGVPKLVQLVPDALEVKESHGIGSKFVNFYGTLDNQSVILPNMAELEANILSINVDNSHLSLAKA